MGQPGAAPALALVRAKMRKPLWKLILKQFDDLLVKILIVAALVDFVIALLGGEGAGAFVEPAVIILILVANATVGVLTETNADKAIDELKAYEADSATVLREGAWASAPASELVPGDVIEVAVGAKVPADARVAVIRSTVLRVDQSILTGESESVSKHAEAVEAANAVIQDKVNMLFSGTVVTAGRCEAVVTATGSSTAIGRIRDAMAEVEDGETPLKRKLDELGSLLSKVIAVICVLVWVVNLPHFKDPVHGSWLAGALYYFKIAVALAVAAIPEGLPAVVTTCLALGTRQMARRNAIVRNLPSVETLGCTTVICSDKTGTLTTNQMTVVKLATGPAQEGEPALEYDVSQAAFAPDSRVSRAGGPALEGAARARAAAPARRLRLALQRLAPKRKYERIGEATELALRVVAEKIGLPAAQASPRLLEGLPREERAAYCNRHWAARFPKIATVEFSRDRRRMSVLCAPGGAREGVLFVKGAPESVLERCTRYLAPGADADDDAGAFPPRGATVRALTPATRAALLQRVGAWGEASALRTLALAARSLPAERGAALGPDDEADLVFLGLAGLHDPPRAEVAEAVRACHEAGIRVIMVTGDNKATASAVARQVGLLGGSGGAVDDSAPALDAEAQLARLTGREFDALNGPEEKAAAAAALAVFARVEPNHKTALVEALKAQRQVVAMTGDGVNDAPALRAADIGVAMGSGTAVAKHAADMVLADDNFATIVVAVAAGRAIFANTKQFIRYMISSNIGEVVAIFAAALLGIPECLNPVQLLWVNLVTDGLPATAIGFNKPDPLIMKQRPRRADEGIVDRWLFTRYILVGAYVGAATVAGFIWWFLSFEDGPQLTWQALRSFQKCEGDACGVFRSKSPSTVSMSVLVVVEMFNALNALSENGSLLVTPPWSNGWLVGAIGVSMALHMAILYTPPLAALFSVQPLSWAEWKIILLLSFPVILLDELLKLASRTLFAERRGGYAPVPGAGLGAWLAPLLPRRLRRHVAEGGHQVARYIPVAADAGLEMQTKRSDSFGRLRMQSAP
ncbi:hypothetical protein QBZ16_004261 [Prototheca wickerhamii]|uniref:Calcium-transporting ATPase n=1 Tax=Prototheca wickerhamii TaxID=3111 RepID=A0AAD9MMR1_PROWI|nr:hypothetical protein QBZ16_004261 [Prototheca wickerhamii]